MLLKQNEKEFQSLSLSLALTCTTHTYTHIEKNKVANLKAYLQEVLNVIPIIFLFLMILFAKIYLLKCVAIKIAV